MVFLYKIIYKMTQSIDQLKRRTWSSRNVGIVIIQKEFKVLINYLILQYIKEVILYKNRLMDQKSEKNNIY